MGKRLWSACSHLPHHVPQCRDSPSSRRGSRAPQRDASQAAAAPVPQARVRVDPLAAALTGDAIMRALPALRPGAKRRYTRAVTDSTRRQNAGRKDREIDGETVRSQSFPGKTLSETCTGLWPVPVSNSSPLLVVLIRAHQSSPTPSLPPSRPAPSSGTSVTSEVSNNYS